ncbi:MDR family MFS transporter [Pseudalkalibacillus berkeleyi]|uniref:MFS transporter n=1 Tax=Pseudalkalibacillus berkeleyi TaxID=1069813 RepID=A0ABS9H454_9BACL|nr:MDR family MFS transporter [Pseudalkalibacillus berkeleyi]MCF6138605.1 MFS transporter [Pseudalkalibacillus berkeleyi]
MEHLPLKKKITIMVAVLASMLFAALNQTIVGTAMPKIVSDLGGMEYFSWIFTIYMLASSVTAILVGKLSDMYGRKPFILIGLGMFIVATFLCGTATSIYMLILYRGLQGLAGGMIFSTAFASIGDLFSPRERGRWQGLMGAVFGLASVFGPTLGGFIVDHYAWKWIFWIFLPIGFVAFVLIMRLFPSVPRQSRGRVDYLGSIFLAGTIIPMLLAFSWAGNLYEWGSFQIIGLFTLTFISLGAFLVAEQKVANPVLPLGLFKNSVFTISNIIGLLIGMAMFGAIMYMPFFIQGVIGTSATKTGFIMMSMMLSMVASSTIVGQLITKTGKYKKLAILGLTIMGIGIFSLTTLSGDSTNTDAVLRLIIIGIGLGCSFPIFTITIQNAVAYKHLGVATSSVQLFRQLGGTIGVSIMGAIMNIIMTSNMKHSAALSNSNSSGELDKLADPKLLMDPDQLEALKGNVPQEQLGMFEQIVAMMRSTLSDALNGAFLFGAIMMVVAVILVLFLKEVRLKTSNQEDDEETEDVQVTTRGHAHMSK